MKKSFILFTGLAAAALFSGCTRIKVSSTSDPSYDFAQVSTYEWIDAAEDILNREDTYLDLELQKALNNELAARGWTQVLESSNATVQVCYYVTVTSHQEFTGNTVNQEDQFAGGLVYQEGEGSWKYEEREPDQVAYTIETGRLYLILSDRTTGTEIWRGKVKARIDRSQPVETRSELFRQVARKLISEIP